ncbi:MAG: hypothetical protein CL772_05655 [Chloroflexi bacterium]|mgnify:CR=1 FL=1|nr:hypothetical protein [Chloroflexota bacterium]|tara:strand:- start:26091 stop:26882 length:792 start_codon:yes stop_codon:yes gene_type:complete
MIKGIIFDLDDTLTVHDDLYDFNYLRTIKTFFPDFNMKNTEVLKIMIETIDSVGSKKYFADYLDAKFGGRDILWADCGGFGEIAQHLKNIHLEAQNEMWINVIKNLGILSKKINIKSIIDKYKFFMWEGIKSFDDVIPTLTKLKRYKLGILTNGMQLHQRKKISISGLMDFFSTPNSEIVTSSECLQGKPFSKPYKYICEKLSLDLNEIIMVGDTLDGDILGAQKLNIKNVLINRKNNLQEQSIKPDHIINSLKDLTTIIEKL